MLEILLDENKLYGDINKELFLEKLNMVFSKFKEAADTFLFSHKGVCFSENCPNISCRGYSFVGNNSQKHIDFVFMNQKKKLKRLTNAKGFQQWIKRLKGKI
ncbi:MAG: hypothetical protein JST21_04615 [Bacteroidetes bacterium]|nr:hypothetical protein [Bacteroidota bacterium]